MLLLNPTKAKVKGEESGSSPGRVKTQFPAPAGVCWELGMPGEPRCIPALPPQPTPAALSQIQVR